MIQGECPVCRRTFKVDDRYAGMSGRCKACGAAIRVPGPPDEGLDGLPAAPAEAGGKPEIRNPKSEMAEEAPQAAAPEAQLAAAGEPHPADELGRPRDARARYEPSHGPTTLEGSWLKEEPAASAGGAAPPPAQEPEPAAPAPQPARAALADRFITPPELEPARTQHRPFLVLLACIALALLGTGFCLHMASAGVRGQVAGGLGVALAGLAVVRLWMARGDGLLAGSLLCLCVAGSALIPSQVPQANRVLLAAAGIALLLLVLTILRRSGRDYFTP